MKRILALILALSLCFAAGCGEVVKKEETGEVVKSEETGDVVKNEETGDVKTTAIALAEYPQMAAYPDESLFWDENGEFDGEGFDLAFTAWREDRNSRSQQPEGYQEGLDPFFAESIREYISGSEGENLAYSPLNVYMALAMLAELTEGESRAQLLDLLGKDDIETLRAQANAIWNANYIDDGALVSILGSSVWLNEDLSFVQETMDTLASDYYASSFKGQMGSPELDKALQDWLNEQTGGMLEEQADSVRLDPETVLALATTVYFRGKWASGFSENNTTPGQFYLPGAEGESVTCDFMHKSGTNTYYWGDKFSSVVMSFEGGGAMKLILPDEGVSVDELLADGEAMDYMLSREDWDNSKHLIVNMSVPKFDIVSDMDLCAGLRNMGVTDIFDSAVSDFSPMTTDMSGIFVSQARHAARVAIDEEGCTAAAFTVIQACGGAMPPKEEVDFVLDRPFIFVLTSMDGLPLFTGVVNNPA